MIRLYESGPSLSKVAERLGFNATTALQRIGAAGKTAPKMKIDGPHSQRLRSDEC